MSNNIKFTYLDSIDINRREHLGYSDELGIVKVYGELDTTPGFSVELKGEVYSSAQQYIITNIHDVVKDSKVFDYEDIMVSDDIIEYQKRCIHFFVNQGFREDMLRKKVLCMLPVYLGDSPSEKHNYIIKAYLARLGYCI